MRRFLWVLGGSVERRLNGAGLLAVAIELEHDGVHAREGVERSVRCPHGLAIEQDARAAVLRPRFVGPDVAVFLDVVSALVLLGNSRRA